jgi:anaerobic magnesium-protoporphyrin IX monomethyl ester cyclase
MFGRKVRTAEPTEVVKALKRARPKKIFFYDDNFFISKRHGRELLKEMIRQQLNIPFFGQIRADSVCKDGKVDRELLHLMWDAGWRLAHLGLESINPATLKEYHKESSAGDMAGGIEALAETGIKTHGMFICGADSDTPESLAETADFALRHGLSSAQFAVLTPLPGTPHTAQLEAEGRILTRNWTLYDGFHVVFWPKQMTPYELQEAMMEANKRFYTAGRIAAIRSGVPVYRKHRLQGYLISRAWEHVRENRDFLWELKALSDSSAPPVALAPQFLQSSLETATP